MLQSMRWSLNNSKETQGKNLILLICEMNFWTFWTFFQGTTGEHRCEFRAS